MDTNTIIEIIASIATLIFGIFGKFIVSHVKNLSTLKAIDNVVEAAVVLAEKAGLVTDLTSSAKFQYAVTKAKEMLKDIGFTDVSETTLEGKIEAAWVSAKDTMEDAYKTDEESSASNKLKEAQATLAEVQAQKDKLEDTKTNLLSLATQIKGVTDTLTSTLPDATSESESTSESTSEVNSTSNVAVSSETASDSTVNVSK